MVYHEGTSPIAGLVDGNTYYVATSINQSNLQGNTRFTDKQVIGLSELENESRAGVLIDIGPAAGTDYKLAAKHVLDSDFATGIGVVARLSAENKASASAGLTSEDPNPGYWSKFTDKLSTPNIADKIFSKLTASYSEAQKAKAGASNSLSVAGALAFTYVDHDVLTDVGGTAELKSNEDLEVKALISQKYTLGAESNAEPTLNSADNVVSVAVNVGIFNNTAKATVHSNAELDGLRSTRVISDVSYPFLTRFDQYIPLSWGEFVDGIRNDGVDAITKYFDSTLGLKDAFFNTWVASTAKGEKVGIAGSVNVMVLTNISEAVVESGVLINQDNSWHLKNTPNANGKTNDHYNQAESQSDGRGEEIVSIEATNYQQTVNMTGIFALPDLKLDVIDDPNADAKTTKTREKYKLKKELSLDPFGTGGSKGGAGGSIFVNVQNNTTHAIVADGAKVYSGLDGGFNMKAEEALFNIHLAQSAGKGGGFAVAGSVVYAGQDSDTLARLGSTATVTGRSARVYAGDLTTTASWAGGVAKGDGLGVGFSLAVNDFDRKTRAVIGNPETSTAVAGDPKATTYINVAEKVDVLAKVDGDLWAFTIAGAVASGDTGGTPPPQDSPLKAQSLLGTDVEPPKSGFGAAAALSVNIVKDNTQASIADSGHLQAGSVTVTATDDFFQLAVTGGASYAKGQAGSSSGSTSLAGAFSFNDLDVKTRAFILDTDIATPGDLLVEAKRSGDLITISAGGSIATGQNGKAIAGSVSINLIYNETEAYLAGVVADVSKNVGVHASDNSRIIAIGGGLAFAFGGKAGVGLGVAANILGSDQRPTITRAYIDSSTLTIGGDSLSVTAKNENSNSDGRIFAITAGIGASTGPDAKLGLGAMLSVNLTTNKTEAYIRSARIDEKLTSGGQPLAPKLNTLVEAKDNSGILAIGGAVGLSAEVAIGAAIGYNEIDNDVVAYLDDVDLTTDGTLTVKATSDAEIGGVAAGVAVTTGSGGKLAGAGSLLINQITNTVDAHISDTVGSDDSTISVGGNVEVKASDDSLIVSIAAGVSVASRGIAVGASVGYNLISDRVSAYIDGATVDARDATSSINIQAGSSSTLVAVAFGVAVSNGNAALGGSLTVNSIANTVDAHIANSTSVHAGDDINLSATESDTLIVVAGGVGFSGRGTAVGAAIAYNFIGGSFDAANPDVVNRDSTATDQLTAYIDNAHVIAGGDIQIKAGYQAPATSQAPTSLNIWSDVVDSGDGLGTVTLPSEASSQVVSVTFGAAAANNFAISGSISINVVAHDISAYIKGSRAVEAAGSILVSAADDVQMAAAAGGAALGQNGGGAGVALQIDKSKVNAYVDAGAIVDAKGNGAALTAPNGTKNTSGTKLGTNFNGLAVTATAFENNNTVTIGLAGGARFGLAGSGSVTVLDRHVNAFIGENALINQGTTNESTQQSVLVLASDRTKQVGVAGSIALGGIAGIGAGIDVDVITKNTQAWIGSGAKVEAKRDVRVQSFSEEKLVSVAAAGGGGLDVGIAGAVDVSVINITSKAFIDASKTVGANTHVTTVAAGGSVQVAAEAKNEIDIISGSVAAGGTAGIGGAGAVPIVTKNTYAYIGKGAKVDARGDNGTIDVRTGTFGKTFGTYGDSTDGQVSPVSISADDVGHTNSSDPNPLVDQQLTGQRIATPGTRTGFTGVAVTAVNQDDIGAYGVGAAGAGTAAIQISATVHVMTANTHAYIDDNAKVNQDTVGEGANQSVLVTAGNDYQHLGVAGGVAIAGTFGATPGVEVSVVTNTTQAYIGKSAHVEAKKDVEVRAQAAEDVLAIAIAIGGGGEVGIGGAFAVLVIDNDTQAYVDNGASVHAGGNVLIAAADATDVDVISIGAGIGIGAAGIGAGIGVSVVTKDTRAWIGSATVDAKGNAGFLTVHNGSLSDSGVFGYTVAADDVRGVAVIAESSENVLSVAIAGAGGLGAGIAGAVTVEVLNSDTRAYIDGNARINTDQTGANDHQDVHVTAANDVTILAIAGAVGGGIAGLAGGVDVGIIHNDTTAYIAGSDVRAKRDIAASALADRDIDSYAISAGGGIVGLGAAVSVYSLGGDLVSTYSYDDNGSSQQGNSLAGKDENGNSTDTISGVDSFMQGAGASDLLGQLANPGTDDNGNAAGSSANSGDIRTSASNSRSTFDNATPDSAISDGSSLDTQTLPSGTSAFIGRNATVSAGRNVDLDARERVDLTLIGGGLGVGGAGIGAGIAILTYNEQVQAFISSGATVSAGTIVNTGDVLLDSHLNSSLSVLGVTGGFGAAVGVAAAVSVINDSSSVKAYFEDGLDAGSGVNILSADAVSINASRTAAIHASTLGAAAGVFGGLGAAVVVAKIDGETRAEVGDWAQIGAGTAPATVGSLTVQANTDLSIGSFRNNLPMGIAIGIGAGAIAAGVVVATIDANTVAGIGDDADITVNGLVTVAADSELSLDVDADGGSLGLVAIGAMFGYANVGTQETLGVTRAEVGARTRILAGSLKVSSRNKTTATVEVVAANGGLIAGGGGEAKATIKPKVEASVGGDLTTLDISGDVTIEAVALDSHAHTTANGGSVAGIAITIFKSDATDQGSTKASVNAGTQIKSGNFSLRAESTDKAESDLFTLGIGLGAGATGDSKANAYATTAVDFGSGAGLTATGTVLIESKSNQTAEADGDSITGGGIAVGMITTRANLTNTNHVRIADAALTAAGNVTLRSDSTSHADADSDGGSGSLIDIAEAEAYATMTDQVDTKVASDAEISSGGTLLVEALRSTELDSVAKVDAGGLGANTTTTAQGTLTSGTTTTEIGDASLSGRTLTIQAKTRSVNAYVEAESEASAAGADSDATALLDTSSKSENLVLTGAALYGRDQVTLGAYHDVLTTQAKGKAITNGLGGDSDPEGHNNLAADTLVDTADGSVIRTRNLLVEANTASNPTYPITLVKDGAVIDFGSESGTNLLTLNQTIEFDATVVMLGSPAPELLIDADGNAVTQVNIAYQQIGNDIVIADIFNTGNLAGTIVFRINPVSYIASTDDDGVTGSGTSTSVIRGNPVFEFITGYDSVKITNRSAYDLRIGAIDVINHSGVSSASITVLVADKSGFHPTTRTATIATDVAIVNDSGADARLTKLISNPYGTTLVSSSGGDIVAGTDAQITSNKMELTAISGRVGASDAPIRLDANLLTAQGGTGVFIEEVSGDMNVAGVSSTAGQVNLKAVGSILDANPAFGADISAPDIVLNALNGSIGTVADPFEIDVSVGSLIAAAEGDIQVEDVAGALAIGQVISNAGSILLSTRDRVSSSDEDILLGGSSVIRALQGAITLWSGDDVSLEGGAVIVAGGVVVIEGDHGKADDAGIGATLDLHGGITAASVTLATGIGADKVNLTQVLSSTRLTTGGNNDTIRVGSRATPVSNTGGVLDTVQARLEIQGGQGVDQLELDDSGEITANQGVLTANTLTGLDMGGPVVFDAVETINLALGSGDDQITVIGTQAGVAVRILMGDGADTLAAGDVAASQKNGLNNFASLLDIQGQGGADTLKISDLVTGTGNDARNFGLLAANRLTGLGMGDASQTAVNPDAGISYAEFETFTLDLGDGVDELQILGTSIPTTLNAGAGTDLIVVGGSESTSSLNAIAAPLTLLGGADGGMLGVSSGVAVDLNLGLDPADTVFGRVTETSMTGGQIRYTGFDKLALVLGDGDDKVSIEDTASTLGLVAGAGDDTVTVTTLSHDTELDMGDGSDLVTVRDAKSALSILGQGNVNNPDQLIVDLQARTQAGDGSLLGSGDVGVLTGFTDGEIEFEGFEQFALKLGSGNDTLIVNQTLDNTAVIVQGGDSDDSITVFQLGAQTATLNGDAGDDTVTVRIDTPPQQAGQFTQLRLSVENLVVDNRNNDTHGVGWTVTDGALIEADSGSGKIAVITSEGAGHIRILGGSQSGDTLDVVSAITSDVQGSVDGNQVDLTTGRVILVPGGFNTFVDYDVVIDFDALTGTSAGYAVEDGFSLSSNRILGRNDEKSPAARLAAGNVVTLTSNTGAFTAYSIMLAADGNTAVTVTFTGTTLNGLTKTVTAIAQGRDPETGLPAFQRFDFTDPAFRALSSLTWQSSGDAVLMDTIVAGRITGVTTGTGTPAPSTVPVFTASANLTFDTTNGRIQTGFIDIDRNRDGLADNGQRIGAGANFTGVGYSVDTSSTPGVAKFIFNGDLVFPSNGVVSATGSRALSLIVANDVTVNANTDFRFSANGATSAAGGGTGGTLGSAGTNAGGGGTAGTAGPRGTYGAGGDASGQGTYDSGTLRDGVAGNPGTAGGNGGNGTAGQNGSSGGNGSTGTGGIAGLAGAGGAGGALGAGATTGGGEGSAGTKGNKGSDWNNGGNGGVGGPGGYGDSGAAGSWGEAGLPGTAGQNTATGLAISGGGSGGGGGGGGSTSFYIPYTFVVVWYGLDGGRGGNGTAGGAGGIGGAGGNGGAGGAGGGGGGAFELIANGRVVFTSGNDLQAIGGNGTAGSAGTAGVTTGLAGNGGGGPGGGGVSGDSDSGIIFAGSGNSGGAGGTGGSGGVGGTGGPGASGAGGAGGTIKIVGSVVNATGTTVNTAGGLAGGNPDVRIAGSGISTTIYDGFFGNVLATRNDTVIYQGNGADGFGPGLPADNFSARWFGLIDVRAENPNAPSAKQSVTFRLSSDDGSWLYLYNIDNNNQWTLLIDNSGYHGYTAKTASVKLSPGAYYMQLDYFEGNGFAGIGLEYQTDTDTVWRPVSVAQDGTNGRMIFGGNTGISFNNNTVTSFASEPANQSTRIERFTGPRLDNPYVTDLAGDDAKVDDTPYIAGLAGGAEIYGLLEGVNKDTLDFIPSTQAINSLPAEQGDALFAVMRLDKGPAGYADDYTGFDMVLFVNLTDNLALSSPSLTVSQAGSPTATRLLAIDGIGAAQNLTTLGAKQVWATLVPERTGLSFDASVQIDGKTMLLNDQALSVNSVVYGKFASSAVSKATLNGLTSLAISPDGAQIYAADPSRNALVVINAGDLSERQLFNNSDDGITGLTGVKEVAVSPDGLRVYAASPGSNTLLIFSRDTATGNLSNPAPAQASGNRAFDTLAVNTAGTRVYTAGLNFIFAYNAVGDFQGFTSIGGLGHLAVSQDDTLVYGTQKSANELVVFDAGLGVVQSLSGTTLGLQGLSGIAVSGDDSTVYVAASGSDSISVFTRNGSTLSLIQTLRNNEDGVRGLNGATNVALSADGRYVLVTGASDNAVSVFQRNVTDGTLSFTQIVRNGVGGVGGLVTPNAIVADAHGVYRVRS